MWTDIGISITDPAPIVVLLGPTYCGKTTSLLLMARYLENEGCRVLPDVMFRRNDEYYQKKCSEFHSAVYDEFSVGRTGFSGFMMVKVVDNNGRTVCQFLDAPGQLFIDEKGVNVFPKYIETIIHSRNRRVWVFFVEPHWGEDQTYRDMYVEEIRNLTSRVHQVDRKSENAIFLFGKADKYPQYFTSNGRPNCQLFYNEVKHRYPGIFAQYERTGMARLLLGKNKFEATPFSAGKFYGTTDGRSVWEPSNDWYPEIFWKAIKKSLRCPDCRIILR